MSDFLSRLVDRTLGTAHPVRPAPRPMRRSGGEAPLALEIEREVETPPHAHEETASDTPPGAAPVRPRAPAPPSPPSRPRREPASANVPQSITPLLPPIEAHLRSAEAPPPLAVEEIAAGGELIAEDPARAHFPSATAITRRQPGPPVPLDRRAGRAQADRAVTAAPPAPVIHVSIGRVEVRAATPPAPPAARAPAAEPPSVALGRYLDERERGRR